MKKKIVRVIFAVVVSTYMTSCSLQAASSADQTDKAITTVTTAKRDESTSASTVTEGSTLVNEETSLTDLTELEIVVATTTEEDVEIIFDEDVEIIFDEENESNEVDETPKKETRVVLDVKNIQQLPELPAGCEITSATMVLNYEGIDIDKMTLETYLTKMKQPDKNGRWASPWDVFIGDPKASRYGCYSSVIIKTVEKFFKANDITSYEIVDVSGSSIEELCAQIDSGHPVIVWATTSMKKSWIGASWKLQDGSTFNWRTKEHCLVLIGYDTDKNTVILSDPYDERGTVEYDMDLFEKRYKELYEQALVIQEIQSE